MCQIPVWFPAASDLYLLPSILYSCRMLLDAIYRHVNNVKNYFWTRQINYSSILSVTLDKI